MKSMVTKDEMNAVAQWIKNYIHETGKEKAVVGLSGGIDSAVVAALCVEALGKENVFCVALPCLPDNRGDYGQDYEDALLVAERLGIPLYIDNIFKSYNTMMYDVQNGCCEDHFFGLPEKNALIFSGNIKARLRMIKLYGYAELLNGIVVGTTNRSEMMTGYATKYGDHGVDIEPFAQFYKREIKELAVMVGLPKQIITKTSSAGLWEGQTDEGELGIKYDKLDVILDHIERSKGNEELPHGVSEQEHSRILTMVMSTEHKRNVTSCYQREEIDERKKDNG
jgi:NAD+ synthase